MFCTRCGTQIDGGASFCQACGAAVAVGVRGTVAVKASSGASTVEDKNLPLAIGLNFLLPGVGYMYMGRVVVGIGAMLLVSGMFAVSTTDVLVITWLGFNAIMAIDMVILFNKRKSLAESSAQS